MGDKIKISGDCQLNSLSNNGAQLSYRISKENIPSFTRERKEAQEEGDTLSQPCTSEDFSVPDKVEASVQGKET